MAKTKISDFLNYFYPHAVETNRTTSSPPEHQYGYIMGAKGEILTEKLLTKFANYQSGYSPSTYIKKGKKWLGRPVFDCNGMSERFTGVDTKARYNYRDQCNPKSPTKADKALACLPQMPGVAVFSGDSAGSISHVGYLLYKYGAGALDWYVVEARGVDYGVVITKRRDRNWRWWGVMSKYFDYDVDASWRPGKGHEPKPEPTPTPTIRTAAKSILVTCGTYNKRENAVIRYEQVWDALESIGGVYWQEDVFIAQVSAEYYVTLGEFNKRPAPSAETRRTEALQAFTAADADKLYGAVQIIEL